jgi:hypothetical protein
MAEMFGTTTQNITQHVTAVYEEGELEPGGTRKSYLQVRQEGGREVRRSLRHYNLDMIISVGYRVRSKTATAFRIWATQRLREFIVKGFVLDDERLQNPDLPFDYFDELLERIQAIRTSERRFYQKITDVYATSIDYDPDAELTQTFFATVQNKLHWAITGQTAAEVVRDRADATKPNMGLTSWRGAQVRKADVGVAKNYYYAQELQALNDLVEQYLVFAAGQARRQIAMHMQDWITKLDGFLTLNDRDILNSAGKVSHRLAQAHAESQYEIYKQRESKGIVSDFDRFEARALARAPEPKKPGLEDGK